MNVSCSKCGTYFRTTDWPPVLCVQCREGELELDILEGAGLTVDTLEALKKMKERMDERRYMSKILVVGSGGTRSNYSTFNSCGFTFVKDGVSDTLGYIEMDPTLENITKLLKANLISYGLFWSDLVIPEGELAFEFLGW